MSDSLPFIFAISIAITTLVISVGVFLKFEGLHAREDKEETHHKEHTQDLGEIGHGIKNLSNDHKSLAESMRIVEKNTEQIKTLLKVS